MGTPQFINTPMNVRYRSVQLTSNCLHNNLNKISNTNTAYIGYDCCYGNNFIWINRLFLDNLVRAAAATATATATVTVTAKRQTKEKTEKCWRVNKSNGWPSQYNQSIVKVFPKLLPNRSIS